MRKDVNGKEEWKNYGINSRNRRFAERWKVDAI